MFYPLTHRLMYRGVVRVFDEVVTQQSSNDIDPFPPSSPLEKELTRAVEELRSVDDSFGSYKNSKSSQTDFPPSYDDDRFMTPPIGYAVPRIFVRSAAEAIEQGVVTYCQLLKTADERRNAILFLIKEIHASISNPRHLYFEVFEPNPIWYDYARVSVFDCVTATQLGCTDLHPPTTRAIVHNVNIPLYETAVVTEESVPHMPQVEISLLKYSDEERNRTVGQSVIVPLDLFVSASNIIIVLENGEEREISYKAALVRKELLDENDVQQHVDERTVG